MGITDEICNCCGAFVEGEQFEKSGGYCVNCGTLRAGDEITLPNGATLRKLQDAQPAGEYKPTTVDAEKAAADFRITYAGKKWTIVWRDGRTEQVTDTQLAELQCKHRWMADF